jgi:Flp pilus assembly pilin Flp
MKWALLVAVLALAVLTVLAVFEPQIKHTFHHTVKTVTSVPPSPSASPSR